MDPEDSAQRHDELTADIAARLQPVCRHLSDSEFRALVRDIARMKGRFREIERDRRFWAIADQAGAPLAPLPPESDVEPKGG